MFAGRRLRLTLIDRYLLGSLLGPMAALLPVTFVAMMLDRALRLVNEMAANGAHLRFIFGLIGSLAPYYLGLALPASFMIAILTAVARLDDDLELEAMLASGVSLARIVVSLAAVGAAVGALTLLVIGFLEPYGRYAYRSMMDTAVNAGWTAELQAGAFQSRIGQVTITADRTDASGRRLRGVFIHRRMPTGGEMTVAASSGVLSLWPDGRSALLKLDRGVYVADQAQGPPTALWFRNYVLLDPFPPDVRTPPRGLSARELTLTELAGALERGSGPIARSALAAEFWGRLARGLSTPLLPLLAIPLAMAPKRGRRAAGVLLAAGVMIASHEALRLAQGLGATGHADPLAAIGSLFAAFAALVLFIFLANRRTWGDSPVSAALARLGALLGRLPRLRFGLHVPARNFGAYVALLFASWTVAAALVLVAMTQMVDLFEHADDILQRGLGLAGLVRYCLLRLPINAERTAGLASLAGAALTFIRLARSSELVAARGAGVSLRQLLRMALPVALAVGVFTIVLAETATPAAQLALSQWWSATDPVRVSRAPQREWFRIGDDIVVADKASEDGTRLGHVVIYRRGRDRLLDARVMADQVVLARGSWSLEGVTQAHLSSASIATAGTAALPWTTKLKPADVTAVFAKPFLISASTAWRSLAGVAATNQSRGFLVTRLFRAAAEPLAPLVMLLLALPLALAPPRSGPSLFMLVYVGGAGLAYVVLDGLLTAAGQTGLVPAWIGACSAPALFGAIGFAVLAFRET